MAIDYRKLLKACIRGQVYDFDVPSVPCENPEILGDELSADERREIIDCMKEVLAEEGPNVSARVAKQLESDFAFFLS